jgi:hypothetical protein
VGLRNRRLGTPHSRAASRSPLPLTTPGRAPPRAPGPSPHQPPKSEWRQQPCPPTTP